MNDPQTELTETQMAYNVAQSDMFQLAAYGHHRYHPLVESLTDEGKRQERDYNDRLLAAREELEAALLRLVAEHAETFPGERGAAWLRSLADDPAVLSLLAVRPDERDFDTEPATPPADQAAIRDRIAETATPFFANFSDEEAATANAGELANALMAVLRGLTLRELEQLYRPNTPPSRPEPKTPPPADRAAAAAVVETGE